ncbi:MAG TPA: glycosyltransferase family 39 protein [Saprospiraceae bacterium]|nr:glycosyltransferase family 39 protein [Saprospiraceae bacterium]
MSKKPKSNKVINSSIKLKSTKGLGLDKNASIFAIGALIVFLLIYFLIRLHFKEMSFERDEGTYAYMGKLLLEGKKPYSYFYEMKPPGLFYMYGVMVALFGTTVSGLHIGFFLVNLITSVFVFLWIKKMLNQTSGVLAAIAYSIISTSPHASGLTIQAEHLLNLFMIPGLWLLWEALTSNKKLYWFLSGIFLSWALLIKQNTIFFIAFAGIVIILYHFIVNKGKTIKKLIQSVLLFSAGILLPIIIVICILLINGSFSDFIFFIYEFPKTLYLSSIEFSRGMGYMKDRLQLIMLNYALIWYMAILGLLLVWLIGKDLFIKIVVSLFLLLSLFSVAPGLRFYGHYWIHFLPTIALLFAVFVNTITQFIASKNWTKSPQFLSVAILAIVVFENINTNKEYYFQSDPERVVRMVYGSNLFPESRKVSEFLNRKMNPEDGLIVLGSEPQIYLYTNKDCASRHFYCGNLVQKHPKVTEWATEFKSDFGKANPKYAIWVQHPFSWSMPKEGNKDFVDWAYGELVNKYHPIGYADYIDQNTTEYIWDQAAVQYKPKGKEYMIVLERNN